MEDSFPLPKCWQDESRVQVLLAPFRERSVNPENYDSKMNFWKDMIAEYCIFKHKATVCKQELQQTFTLGHRVLSNSCIDTVIDEMVRLKLLRLREEYEYDPANTWAGWAMNSFWKKPLHWGRNKIMNVFGTSDMNQMSLVEFVHLGIIEKYCQHLQDIFKKQPYAGAIYQYAELRDKLGESIQLSEDSMKMCLITLNCQHKIGLSYKNDQSNDRMLHLVKIPSTSEPEIAITERDLAMYNLKSTKDGILKQLEEIELHIRDNEQKARDYVKENKRLLAKTYLRKKQLLEKKHEKRSLALHNIEMLLSNVDEVKHNEVILGAYRYGSKALQHALETSNLTLDNVDEVVSEMRDTMDNYKELQDTLENVQISSNDDVDELELELRELLNDTSDLKSPTDSKLENINKNILEDSIPHKVEITDAELIAMLEGLDVEHNSPAKNVSVGETKT